MKSQAFASIRVLIAAVAVLFPAVAACYQTATHADMSEKAVLSSQRLSENLPNLGLSSLEDKLTLEGTSRNIRNWVREGAVREDDTSSESFARYRHHFFDPTPLAPNNGGFTGFLGIGLFSGRPAPDWALEPTPIASQIFGFKDARSYFLEALTQSAKADRDSDLALTFRTIGQVIHLVQDVGQPQHTRNDSHLLGSLFERYTNRERSRFTLLNGTIPEFFNPRDFFANAQGTGLAQYTNRAFVSQDTNFRWDGTTARPSARYASPEPLPNPVIESVHNPSFNVPQVIRTYCGPDPICNMRFYESRSNRGEPQSRAATLSIFADDLDNHNIHSPEVEGARFSLNRLNFEAILPELVPRAIGYSTGMINYFFRGKIDYVPDPAPGGHYLVKNLGTEPMKGKFRVYYDDQSGTRHEMTDFVWDTEVILAGAPTPGVLAPGESMPVPGIVPPVLPAPKTLGEYILVFSGEMGEERPENGSVGAVVAKAIVNPYNGVLYLAGLDGAGQLQFFKVDKNGVSTSTDRIPFGVSYVDNTVRERPYDFKQVVFTTTPSGALIHKTVGLELKTGSLGSFANVSFVPDPVSGAFRFKSGVVWIARSPDPTIGTFEFTWQIQGSLASLSYTRSFLNANGQATQAFGVLPLPEPFDFRGGRLLLSGDGTTIYPRGSTTSRHGWRIKLGAIPSVEVFDLPQGSASVTDNPSRTVTQTGICSVDYMDNRLDGSPSFPATTSVAKFKADIVIVDRDEFRTSMTLEDLLKGELLSYEIRNQSRRFDHFVSEGCIAAAVDYSIPLEPRVKVDVQASRHSSPVTARVVDTYVLPNGSFQHVIDNVMDVRPANAFMGCGITGGQNGPVPAISNGGVNTPTGLPYLDLDYSYQGFGPCPDPVATVFDLVDVGVPKQRLIRALTDRPEDALYSDATAPGMYKFRGDTVPASCCASVGSFVTDASPIGEVFFATPDLSILIHEPKEGNMPVLRREMIPNGIVKLLAAIWL